MFYMAIVIYYLLLIHNTDTIALTLTYYSRVLNRFHTVRDDTKSRVNLDEHARC